MKWKDKLIKKITAELEEFIDPTIGVHLAVFNEPFLALLYKGEKKIESRFSVNRVSPYNRVAEGDIVILKSSGGPVSGFFIAGKTFFFSNLNEKKLNEIKGKYGKEICSDYDPNFWVNRRATNYATLVVVKQVFPLEPFKIEKKDRTAWTILQENSKNLLPVLKTN